MLDNIISEGVVFGYEKKAIISEKNKLFSSIRDNIEWFFDLEKDPKELNPIKSGEIFLELKEK